MQIFLSFFFHSRDFILQKHYHSLNFKYLFFYHSLKSDTCSSPPLPSQFASMATLKELYTTLKSLCDMKLPVDDKLLKAADNLEG